MRKTVSTSDVLYSSRIATSMNTFIIDGVCVKNRGGEDLSTAEILRRVTEFENIGIQVGNVVSIYCSSHSAMLLKDSLQVEMGHQYEQAMNKAINDKLINIYTVDNISS